MATAYQNLEALTKEAHILKNNEVVKVLLTTDELAARWGRSPRSLANDRSAGRGIRYIRLGGGTIRYYLSDIEKYEAACTVEPVGA